MLTKAKVIQLLQKLPNEFSLDEIRKKLILLEKIEIGLQQVKEGKVLSSAEVQARLKR